MKNDVAATHKELSQILAEAPFAKSCNFKLHSFGSGECTLVVPFDESLERPGGIVAGSILMTAADVAMWLAIMTRLGTGAMSVTTEMTTNFLSSARREDVRCTARILKLGKSLIYGTAECTSDAGRRLTHHTITYIRLDR
jgi:uncharacterized protein (TIGR00369 family)